MGEFAVGQSVPREEDPRFLTGDGEFLDDINLRDQAWGYVLRSPHAMAGHPVHRHVGSGTGARRSARPDRRGLAPLRTTAACPARTPRRTNETGRRCFIRPTRRWSAGRPGWSGTASPSSVAETQVQARDAGGADRRRLRPVAVGTRYRDRGRAGRPRGLAGMPGQYLFRRTARRRSRGRCGVRAGRPHRPATPGHQPCDRRRAGTARVSRRLRQTAGPVHALHRTAEPPPLAVPDRTPGLRHSGDQRPRHPGRCRRQLRHARRHLQRARAGAVGVAAVGASGEVALRPLRGVHLGYARSRQSERGGARPRQGGKFPRAPGQDARQHGRLSRDPRTAAADQQSRHPGRGLPDAGGPRGGHRGVYEHVLHQPVSRVGRPRGGLSGRAADRDLAASELGMDPADIRQKNSVTPDQMPWTNALGFTYDCGDFPRQHGKGARGQRLRRVRGTPRRCRRAGHAAGHRVFQHGQEDVLALPGILRYPLRPVGNRHPDHGHHQPRPGT